MNKRSRMKKLRDCRTDPCETCQRRAAGMTCGSCSAGIVIMNGREIQRCDVCSLFETDDDAAEAVAALLQGLHAAYVGKPGSTVADAIDLLVERRS